MARFTAGALFYPVDIGRTSLQDLVRGTSEPVALDTVEFGSEDGGEAVRQLALPRLPGMDEVEIELAQMQIQAVSRPTEISDFTMQAAPGNQGVFLALPKPGRLLKVELEYALPPLPPNLRLVVRAVEKTESGFQPGVPLFAVSDFSPPGSMFPRALSGMSQTSQGANRFILTLPSVMGDAWLIQLAAGDNAVELAPNATPITIRKVILDSVPSNVAVVLVTAKAEVPLWGNPQMLLPSDGLQDITFTPLAQKELSAALKTPGDELTLPLTLKFHSDTAGALGIFTKALPGRYIVRPIDPQPAHVHLGGTREPLVLTAPPGLTAQSSTFRITAKLKGWELNGASPEPPAVEPSSGLKVTQAKRVAQQARFSGQRFPLVNVRLRLAARTAAETIAVLHEDSAGAPGAAVGKPVVRQIDSGADDWFDFELKEPLTFRADSTPIWIVLRVTKGEILWFASGTPAATLVSTDEGASWGLPDTRLAPLTALLAQLFHDCSPELSRPRIRVDGNNTPLIADLMANAIAVSPSEYLAENFAMPASIVSFFAHKTGGARVEQKLELFSPSVLDLRVESASFFYDPFQAGAFGG